MDIIEKIKAEIKSRIEFHNNAIKNNAGLNVMSLTHAGGLKEDEYLLSFLSTLEPEKPVPAIEEPIDGVLYAAACGIKNAAGKSEKPSEGLEDWDFDREITLIWGKCAAEPNDQIACLHIESFIEIARHFAQWGADHLSNPNKAMEIDIEKECEPYTEMLYVPELSPELNSALKRLSRSYLYNFGCHIRNLILGIPEDNQKVEEMVDDIYKSIFEKQ